MVEDNIEIVLPDLTEIPGNITIRCRFCDKVLGVLFEVPDGTGKLDTITMNCLDCSNYTLAKGDPWNKKEKQE